MSVETSVEDPPSAICAMRSASSRNTVPARCRYVFVVANDECPAFVMTAISLAPDAASSVIAVCLRSWNGRNHR
jgi:hypothetical protein